MHSFLVRLKCGVTKYGHDWVAVLDDEGFKKGEQCTRCGKLKIKGKWW